MIIHIPYFSIQTTDVKLPKEGMGDLRVFNGYKCPLKITILPETKEETKFKIDELDFYVEKNLVASKSYPYKAESACAKNNVEGYFIIKSQIQASYYFKDAENEGQKTKMTYFVDDAQKSFQRDPKIRFLLNSPDQVWIRLKLKSKVLFKFRSFNLTKTIIVRANTYDVQVEDRWACQISVDVGGVYTVMLSLKEGSLDYVRIKKISCEIS